MTGLPRYSVSITLKAHTHYTDTGKWVCNPLVPGPVQCPVPSLDVVYRIKGIIYKPIVPVPVPVPCSVNEP